MTLSQMHSSVVIQNFLLLAWFATVSFCICPELSAPSNGTLTLTDGTNPNSQATYTCDEGFTLQGSSPRFCRSNGFWTGLDVTCEPVNCGSLSSPVNGQVVVPITTLGNTAVYSCNNGFALVGDETRECQVGGDWSGSQPTCVVDCGSLEHPENGIVIISGTREGDTATYSCNEGFVLNENSTNLRTCGENGTWSGDEPACTIINCGDLPNPPNGDVSFSTDTSFGSEASYSCDIGYTLNGCETRLCQANGNWSNSEPECINADHGELDQKVVADCGELRNPPNGVVDLNETTFGSVAEYFCDEGFIIMGNTSTSSCQLNGRWTEEPICIDIECEELLPPDNGSIIIGPRTVGSLAIYLCDDGFTLSIPSPAFRRCGMIGLWSGTPPMCDPVDCGDLDDIPNGFVSLNGTVFGSTAMYSCNEAFRLQGSPERICEATGQWSGSEPTCEIQCPEECDISADCVEIEGLYTCICFSGFVGNGQNCTDVDECSSNPCHPNADCNNTLGSYFCTCQQGFEGDGINTCSDINECATIGCDENAICLDTPGSFDCFCNSGFEGDGATCLDINECDQADTCDENAQCGNTAGSFECTCNERYFGDGINCAERCSFNFQILLEEIRDCDLWRFEDTQIKLSDISEDLLDEISEQCISRDSCLPEFTQELDIIGEEFTCGPRNRPLYRASLRGTETENCEGIESILNGWIRNGSASITVQGNRLSIADFCEVEFDSFTDPIECDEPTTEPPRTEQPLATTSAPQSGSTLSSQTMVAIAGGIAGLIVLVVIIGSVLFVVIVLAVGMKSKKKKSHSHYFEHDLTSPDDTHNETVLNNNSAVETSPLRPTYSNFNTPDPAIVARMSTFNPQGDVIPTLIRTYSSNSLSRNRIHTTVMENHGASELTDDEFDKDDDNSALPSP